MKTNRLWIPSLVPLFLLVFCQKGTAQGQSPNVNYALALDGATTFVTIAPNTALRLTTFTLEVMVRFDDVHSGLFPIVTEANLNQWNSADGFGVIYEQGHISLRIAKGPREAFAFARPWTIQPHTWYQISCTFDGRYGRIFVDGILVHQDQKEFTVYYGDAGLRIGHALNSYYGGEVFFKGQIDEVRIWNYVRSEAQIREYSRRPLQGNENGLLGYWNFDQQNGMLEPGRDHSLLQNHGQLNGRIQLVLSTAFSKE